MKSIKIYKNKLGFTLVELIVTITIIAILGTIASVYFQSHNKNSRDSVRVTDIKNLEKALGVYIADKGNYPEPDLGVNINYSGSLAWTQGIIGENLLMSLKVSKVVDPLTLNYYTYSLTAPKNGYQIGSIREGNNIQGYNFINTTYAADKTALAIIRGTYNQKVLRVSSGTTEYILTVPSIISSDISFNDLQTIIDNRLLVYNNYGNIPSSYSGLGYTMTGGFDFVPSNNIVVYSGSFSETTKELNRLLILNGIKKAYKGTIIENNYKDIVTLDISQNQKQALVMTNSIGNIIGSYDEKGLPGSYYYQLSSGGNHTCGIKVGDKLYCWGLNTSGQLGDNTTIQKNGPALVYSGSDYLQVSAGGNHTCGIKADGKLYCWGSNGYGQIGDNTTNQRNLPILISSGSTFKQVALGSNHTCAIRNDSKLYCWGRNAYGQLGDGSQTQRNIPTAIDSGNNYIYIGLGSEHTCGIRTDGKLYCWGLNTSGQLGRGNTTSPVTSPFAIDAINNYKSILLGGSYTCGVRTDGKLYCWGNNGNGKLGDGTTSQRTSPVIIASGSTFSNITTSLGNHTCGIKTDGKLYCWGFNNYSQLGDGTLIQKTSPTAIDSANNYSLISAGINHTCGMKVDGKLTCWGYNGNGQLGNGVDVDSKIPLGVDSNTYKALYAGANHNCAIGTDDKISCWGLNTSGQIGDNTYTNRFNLVKVDTGSTYSSISAGGAYTCGLRPDGKLYCWGSNGNGQYGRGNTSSSIIPVWVATGSTFSKVITSIVSHTCGIRSDGKLYCWGRNDYGQLGDGTVVQKTTPVAIDSVNNYINVDPGYEHSCAIRSDNKLYCWGRNSYRQLGDNTVTTRTLPLALDSVNSYKKVSVGYNYTCAIRSNDKLFCIGNNGNYVLGDGSSTPRYVMTPIASGSTFKNIYAGMYHTCAIRSDDKLLCWGSNSYGQLGDGTATNRNSPILIDSGSTYVGVGLGYYHTCGMRTNGSILCWGRNDSGQLGSNSSNSSSPGDIN